MGLLTPHFWFTSVTQISPAFLRANGITWVALDKDNTLTPPNVAQCSPQVLAWLDDLKRSGITPVLVSNNKRERVQPVAERLGVPFIWRACKPLASGIRRAAKLLDRPLGEGAVIGDQLYTDIGAANLAGVKALLVDPLAEDYESFIVFKRRLEKRHHQKNQHIKQKTLSLLK
ncbi:MAG: YqeG family HAD IIIA-type phosphatase [Clostridia bacterium]|nr:YqeG family HAD IIIA-type phosphatase [Clostridia bacterium]